MYCIYGVMKFKSATW